MKNIVLETLASSTAHGISRAAATQSIPLRVAWILLFLLFIGLFCNNATTLVNKLANRSIVTTVEMDKVPLEVPDIYACPTRAFSGSYPYALTESEAAMVNGEVERLGKRFDHLAASPKWRDYKFHKKMFYIMQSLSPEVMKLLFQRAEQSVLADIDNGTIYLADKRFCFKLKTDGVHGSSDWSYNSVIDGITLFTDPYNPHFNYTGYPVNPIVQGNKTKKLSQWDINTNATFNGYILVFVPKESIPVLWTEATLMLGPGQYYDIKLSMEKVVFSEDLHGKNCSPNEPDLAFMDRLSLKKHTYKFCEDACLDDSVHRASERNHADFAIPWDLREKRRANIEDAIQYGKIERKRTSDQKTEKCYRCACKRRQPCEYPRFQATYSSVKWPEFRGGFADFFESEPSESGFRGPAHEQLIRIAKQLDSGETVPAANTMSL